MIRILKLLYSLESGLCTGQKEFINWYEIQSQSAGLTVKPRLFSDFDVNPFNANMEVTYDDTDFEKNINN